MNKFVAFGIVAVALCCLCATSATAQVVYSYSPVIAPAPVVTYSAPTTVYYSPAPVVTYRPAPVVAYSPAPVVTYSPVTPVYSYSPVYSAYSPVYFPTRRAARRFSRRAAFSPVVAPYYWW